jgi:hypothetical protein
MTSELEDLIQQLNLNDIDRQPEQIQTVINQIEVFNKRNENTFKFSDLDSNKKQNLSDSLLTCLKNSWSCICAFKDHQTDQNKFQICRNMTSSCLNAIRLLSRDADLVSTFENERLLDTIQAIANLKISTDENCVNEFTYDLALRVNALKVMSNLIYNNTNVKDFYVRNCVAEMITLHIKQFIPTADEQKNQAMIFNLRILFLLSTFNPELGKKLREKFQVITYLIEIIDQLMKERLNDSGDSSAHTSAGPCDDSDYCCLKQIDVDIIIEILKILYNLTMEIGKASVVPNSMNTAQNELLREEDEAHLLHLVSVLRDLLTCKIDSNDSINPHKLVDLHGNIVNLLTNMPKICYEELMTPSLAHNDLSNANESSSSQSHQKSKAAKSLSSRLAHDRKRLSRRFKRHKHEEYKQLKQQRQQKDADLFLNDDIDFEDKNIEAIALILSYLAHNLNEYVNKPSEQNAHKLYPVLLLLSMMCKSNKLIRHYCRYKVLPPLKESDLMNLPQSGRKLRNRLVKLMTDANIQVKQLSAQFLFVLCKENVNRLIKYTGYGNAAGLLADTGLMLSNYGDRANYSSSSDDSETEDYKRLETKINQITGRVDTEPKRDIFENMSEEQKEYEAIKLVNQIDKLTRSGFIKPATIGAEGKPKEIEHVLELQQSPLTKDSISNKSD